jgi:hypothetical protein
MTPTRLLHAAPATALAAVVVAVLAGCGGGAAGPTPPAAPPAPAATTAPAEEPAGQARADVEGVFRDVSQALLARDFPAVCAVTAPETTEELLAAARARGVPAGTCDEALTAIYATPATARIADRVVTGAAVQDVTVTGDDATVTWSADIAGGRPTLTTGLRRVDGRWQVTDPGV